MPYDKAILKVQVNELTKKELVDIVLKLAKKRSNYAFLLTNYIEKEEGEQTLFEETLLDIDKIIAKEFNGRTIQHQQVKRFNACVKRVNEFGSDVKNKKLEVDLIVYLLKLQFSNPVKIFGAKISGYDYKVGLLLKKLISVVCNKLHPDYLADYQDIINDFLAKIHKTSNKINTIRELPKNI